MSGYLSHIYYFDGKEDFLSFCLLLAQINLSSIIDLIDWGFIYQKHIDSPTYPHLGKVGQIYDNIMVGIHAVVDFCCC